MRGIYLYEYAVIRYVPKVEREEFINVGLILFSRDAHFIRARIHIDDHRLSAFSPGSDKEELWQQLATFEAICEQQPHSGKIGQLDLSERFRWLTAVRSASIQTSRPHPGFTNDPAITFDKLFRDLVL